MSEPNRSFITPKSVEYKFRIYGWAFRYVEESRTVHSMFDAGDIEAYRSSGFLLVTGVLSQELLELGRAAIDELREKELGESRASNQAEPSAYQGQYLMNALVRDPRLSCLLQPQPILDSVRSLIGPAIALRASSARVTFPGVPRMETGWHLDRRLDIFPPPPLVTRKPKVAAIIHFDDSTDANGATLLIPGSHRRDGMLWETNGALGLAAMGLDADEPAGAISVTPSAGSVMFFDSSLWHRVLANTATGTIRRVIVCEFESAGARRSFEAPPATVPGSHEAELVKRAEAAGDRMTLEVLGHTWFS